MGHKIEERHRHEGSRTRRVGRLLVALGAATLIDFAAAAATDLHSQQKEAKRIINPFEIVILYQGSAVPERYKKQSSNNRTGNAPSGKITKGVREKDWRRAGSAGLNGVKKGITSRIIATGVQAAMQRRYTG